MEFLSISALRIMLFALFACTQLILCSITASDILDPYERQYGQQVQQPFLRSSRSRIERRDRPCLINAGLSQGCDLSDILYAKYQANKFSSFAGPGRR